MTCCKPLNHSFALALLLLIGPTLGGCSLMSGGKAATMYQFGKSDAQANSGSGAPAALSPVVLYTGSSFERQSRGDRILTSTGDQVAFVAEARWIAPAPELFDAAAIRSLDSSVPAVRVVRIGDRARPDYALTVDVRRFEANYPNGPGSAPEVIVEARAKLVRITDRAIVGDWPIAEREPAGENRVSAIVSAFDRATEKVTGQIASLTAASLGQR